MNTRTAENPKHWNPVLELTERNGAGNRVKSKRAKKGARRGNYTYIDSDAQIGKQQGKPEKKKKRPIQTQPYNPLSLV